MEHIFAFHISSAECQVCGKLVGYDNAGHLPDEAYDDDCPGTEE